MTALAPYPTLTGREPCRAPDVSPKTWDGEDADATAYAQAQCLACPARTQCLAYALDHPAETVTGIWAATTPERRNALRAEFFRTPTTTTESR
ncbi:hypothetical protein RVR_P186 (plasmid) [Actinacidiphila reveromycinica]|uniref:4Fe-4S Wbl-type domain-containing protein n=1 Tax=Actinacidiphila reveromycinica TaxID=659352 RepID=A0A7R6TAC1_9ACTN|nr:WhiB family transcriptional regulator [Streptomyces sp. SN-593]BBG20705.1 hypothetical protein RVR_P186 [Streptomyces sp. SN-593]